MDDSRRRLICTLGKISLACVLACRSSVLQTKASPERSSEPLTFAHITDTQVGYPAVTEKRLLDVVSQINERKPSFVIHTGDVAHFDYVPEWKKFKEIFHLLQVPLYLVPGNHDTGEIPTAKSIALWKKHMGADQFSFIDSNVAFIGANLTPFWQPTDQADGFSEKVRIEIIDWLEKELQKAQNCLARFVFGHFPIYMTDLKDHDYQNSISEHDVRKQILETLIVGRCDAYFCGHTHFGWENKIGLNDKNIRQIAIAPLAYPGLMKDWQDHKFLQESKCLGWYLWHFYPDTGKLIKQFIKIKSNTKTVIFNHY